ncbi:MAG: Maf family protein [Acidimicrobiales bacterium]|nr:Maf family protein [Acidimicrobiales bacterium]
MSTGRIILASSSPRRAALLRQIGLSPTIDPAAIDETLDAGDHTAPCEAVTRLARDKATTVAERHKGQHVAVIGADTVVCIDGEILGKPADIGEAIAMLHRLSGQTHEVHTGVCVVSNATDRCFADVATTRVTMRQLDKGEIAAYVATGEPADAAGAYAIQGRAAVFVERIEGDYTNVVGLPLPLTERLLAQAGVEVALRWTRT